MSKVYGGLVSSPYNKLDTNNGYGVTHTFGGNVVNGGHEEPATITLTTFPESIGAVSGDGIFFKGSSVTVVATPDSESEYPEFDGWYEGETKVSENASYTFTVSGARTLVAKFKEATDPTVIDLALPSGRKWRSMNLGSNFPELSGLYYSWGNVRGHVYSEGYEWGEGIPNGTTD